MDILSYDPHGMSVRIFMKNIEELRIRFKEVTGKEIPAFADLTVRERFEEVLNFWVNEVRTNAHSAPALNSELQAAANNQPILSEMIADGLIASASINSGDSARITLPPDIDDVSPNAFKSACLDEAKRYPEGDAVDVPLPDFLRVIIKAVGLKMGWSKRINIGANRHFPRMVEWLREIQNESEWEDGSFGFRLMNAKGAGQVRGYPTDPSTLKIRIRSEYL